jgi:hypothetical protein
MWAPNRIQTFSGFNPDGSPFISSVASGAPVNAGFYPAPKCFVSDTDVTSFPPRFDPDETIILNAHGFVPALYFFKSTATQGLDDKGSFNLVFNNRVLSLPNNNKAAISFVSFRYECLLWDVGTTVDFSSLEGPFHLFTQGVRKGCSDSAISKMIYEPDGSGRCSVV